MVPAGPDRHDPRRRAVQRRRSARPRLSRRLHRRPLLARFQRRRQLHRDRDRRAAGAELHPIIPFADVIQILGAVMSVGTTTVATPRLDMWLADSRHITRHAARTLIDAGLVTVDGRPGRPGQRVRDTADVVVTPPPAIDPVAETRPAGTPGPPTVLHIVDEDEWLAVVDKPSGMVVH